MENFRSAYVKYHTASIVIWDKGVKIMINELLREKKTKKKCGKCFNVITSIIR